MSDNSYHHKTFDDSSTANTPPITMHTLELEKPVTINSDQARTHNYSIRNQSFSSLSVLYRSKTIGIVLL